jgi:carboxymethylenebutenolidase
MNIVRHEISLQTPDGQMPCHLATPASGGPHPAIVVLMEGWELNDQLKRIADRMAAEGFVTIVPNLYWRHPDNVVAYDNLQGGFRLMATIRYGEVVADVTTAIDHLKSLKHVKPRFGTTGFCMGGTLTFLTACRIPEIAATVPFYGAGMVTRPDWAGEPPPGNDTEPPIKYVAQLNAPVLGFFGGKDSLIPIVEVDKLRDELKKAGKIAEIVLYEDADHAFMNEDRPSYHPEHARDAFAKTIAFFRQHLD